MQCIRDEMHQDIKMNHTAKFKNLSQKLSTTHTDLLHSGEEEPTASLKRKYQNHSGGGNPPELASSADRRCPLRQQKGETHRVNEPAASQANALSASCRRELIIKSFLFHQALCLRLRAGETANSSHCRDNAGASAGQE